MKITKKFIRFTALLMCLFMILAVPAAGFTAFTTYSYTIHSFPVEAPHAYVPEMIIDSDTIGLHFLDGVRLDSPQDVFVDRDNNVYIADTRNDRIVILYPDFTGKAILSQFVNQWGVPDGLDSPRGVFATDREIYVADTGKNRLVVFSRGNDGVHAVGEHLRIIEQPHSDIFPDNHVYTPVGVVVDRTGRIYVVSSTTNLGVIVMNPAGDFQGFIGAQRASVDPFTIFWRNFQTREQRAQTLRAVSTEFNNIALDDEGFVWVTTSSISESDQLTAMMNNDGAFSPVKRLNPQGTDILRRTGPTSPAGAIPGFSMGMGRPGLGASRIIDVAMGPEGTWSIIDETRERVFTYDEHGRLLFAFGDRGNNFGNTQNVTAIAYQGTRILLLDRNNNNITTFRRTEYGDIMIRALENQRNRQFDRAVDDWREILMRNNNSDLAYIGIGRSLHRDGDYAAAMREFRFALDVGSYSRSFQAYRRQWIEQYVIVIPIVVFAVVFGLSRFFKNATKVNKRDAIRGDRKLKLSSHLLYGFHIIFHPFDGFWDMKHEKRGSALAGTIFMALAAVAYFYQSIGSAFIVNPYGFFSNIVMEAIMIIVPVTLWIIANWCLTTLFDGEGSMKDIYMATCYALVPIAPIIFTTTLLSHIVVQSEVQFLNLLVTAMFVWVGMLLFFGAMVVHDYSLGKNILTVLGSVVGMAFIMFIAVLFSSLLMRMVMFVNSIAVELSYRI